MLLLYVGLTLPFRAELFIYLFILLKNPGKKGILYDGADTVTLTFFQAKVRPGRSSVRQLGDV